MTQSNKLSLAFLSQLPMATDTAVRILKLPQCHLFHILPLNEQEEGCYNKLLLQGEGVMGGG